MTSGSAKEVALYLVLFLMTCTPGGAKVPCTYQRVKEPMTLAECGRYLDGKLYDGLKMFFCGTDQDLTELRRTKGMAASLDGITRVTQRLTSQISR